MVSPLSVSNLIGAKRRYFDVVIFDEASQVLPEDAVPAMLRAGQAVVAGDRHQLPPTTFFMGGAEAEEEEAVVDYSLPFKQGGHLGRAGVGFDVDYLDPRIPIPGAHSRMNREVRPPANTDHQGHAQPHDPRPDPATSPLGRGRRCQPGGREGEAKRDRRA